MKFSKLVDVAIICWIIGIFTGAVLPTLEEYERVAVIGPSFGVVMVIVFIAAYFRGRV